MAFEIDKIGLFSGYKTNPAIAQGAGPAFGTTTPIKGAIELPKKQLSPSGHRSPVVQNETLANRLDLFA